MAHGKRVEVRRRLAAGPAALGDFGIQDAEPGHDLLIESPIRQRHVEQTARRLDVLGVIHAGHANADDMHEVDLRLDVFPQGQLGVHRRRRPRRAIDGIEHSRQHFVHLRVRAHGVVALHEGFHRDLPIGRQHRRVPPFHPQLVDVVVIQAVGERAKIFPHWRRVVVEVDEDVAAPLIHATARQIEVGLIELLLAEVMLAVDEGVLAIHVPAPAVERADEPVGLAVAMALGQTHTAMAAGIVIGLHTFFGPDDDHRLVENLVLGPVADVLNLLQAASHLPRMRPQALALEPVELFVVIALCGNPLGVGDRERYRPTGIRIIRH